MTLAAGPAIAVGVDVGGTKVLAGAARLDGTLLSRVMVMSRDLAGRPDALLDRIAEVVRSAAYQAGVGLAGVQAVGLGLPGPLDAARSVVSVAPNLGWAQVAARDEMERRLAGPPVFLENDVRSAALAEHVLGAGAGYGSLLAVFVGTGVGGGLVLDGRVYHGSKGGAGEIGHMVVEARGPTCPCGRRGCLEALAARGGVAAYVVRAVKRGRRTALTEIVQGDLSTLTSGDLAVAIQRHRDRVARDAARHSARYVGLAVGGTVNLLDPDVVVIGGGVAEALGEEYVAWVAGYARRQILAEAARALPIVPARLGADAGLLGAALVAFAGLAQRPAAQAAGAG